MSAVNVWIDINANGKLDDRDPTALSDSKGIATFRKVPDGSYTARIASSLSYPYLGVKALSAEVTVPDLQRPNPYSTLLFPAANGHLLVERDHPPVNQLSGKVFFDKDRNGNTSDQLGDADAGISGVRVFLDIDRDGLRDKTEPSTLTRADGSYTLNGMTIFQMSSPIGVSRPTGYAYTTPAFVPGQEDVQASFGLFRQEATSTVHFDLSINTGDAYPPAAVGYLVYLDLNRDAKWQRGEPRVSTDENGDASFKVLPGKYRLRVITPPTLKVNRRYEDIKVGDRQSRLRQFTISGAQTFYLGFYHDVNGNRVRDTAEELLTYYHTHFVDVKAKEYGWWHASNGVPGHTIDSRGYIQLSNAPGTLTVSYEYWTANYVFGGFPTIRQAEQPSSLVDNGVWEIPLEFFPTVLP